MSAPRVNIALTNGAIGGLVASKDGVSALVTTGMANDDITLGVPFVIYSLDEAIALGIEETGDNANAYRHISEFYLGYNFITGKESAELYVMLLSETVTLAEMCDAEETVSARELLAFAQNNVRILGVCRKPADAYTPTLTDGIDSDSIDALITAQALANTMFTAKGAIGVFLEMRSFELANIGNLEDMRTHTQNKVTPVMFSTQNDGSASVGFVMGLQAGGGVAMNVGKNRNGALPVTDAWNGNLNVEDTEAYLDALHDKGYLVARAWPNKAGIFINDDPTASPTTDDYCQMTRVLPINKAARITDAVLTEWINQEVRLEDGGKLDPGVIATIQADVDRNININMVGEISNDGAGGNDGSHAFIDKDQNIGTTNTLQVVTKVRPLGYLKNINVKLGYTL